MNLKLICILYLSKSQLAKDEAFRCSKEIELRGIEIVVAPIGGDKDPLLNLFSELSTLPDLAIVLGGDGTVLGAARHLATHGIPILSFNVGGNLGFLTHDKNQLNSPTLWERIMANNFYIQPRMMLEACIENRSNKHKQNNLLALNDFYFRSFRDEISPTCSLQLEIDGEIVDQYKGDGLILSTPTGSTAYAMASGGPILHPDIEGIIVSAICPMSLSSRPVVVPVKSKINIRALGNENRRVKLWQDGSSGCLVETDDNCIIQKSKYQALMINLENSPSYFRTLSKKLHWAGSLSQKQN